MNSKDILWRWQSGYKTTNVQCRHSWIKKKLKLGQHELLQIVQFKYVSRSLKLVNCCLQLISRLSLCKLEILNQYSTSSLLWEHFFQYRLTDIIWVIRILAANQHVNIPPEQNYIESIGQLSDVVVWTYVVCKRSYTQLKLMSTIILFILKSSDGLDEIWYRFRAEYKPTSIDPLLL